LFIELSFLDNHWLIESSRFAKNRQRRPVSRSFYFFAGHELNVQFIEGGEALIRSLPLF
jgi:hypothetical protein